MKIQHEYHPGKDVGIMCKQISNLSFKQGMVEKLREFAARTEHATSDACIICLLSHGEEGYMFGTDGKKIPLEEIFLLFDNRHCPALLNKPKIFFIQACRGGEL